MLAGLIAPSSGDVRVDGETLTRRNAPRLRQRIGLLTEAPGLWDRLTVRRNLEVYARLYGIDHPERAVDEALDIFGIRERAADPAAQLSKGLKQRVALARTLLHRPDAVLLDEPTSGLDPESARTVRDLVLRLRDEQRTVVVSTHNLDEVDRIADRVAVMRGRLVALDTPSGLRARLFGARVQIALAVPDGRFTLALSAAGFADVRSTADGLSVGVEDSRSNAPVIVRCLVDAGAEIVSVAAAQPSLEDVYLRLLEEVRP
jgi:ABC-2 type transport system ATP-binding protein